MEIDAASSVYVFYSKPDEKTDRVLTEMRDGIVQRKK